MDADLVRRYEDNQALSFYSDIANILQDIYPDYHNLNILDVGSRSAYGTNYLGNLFSYESFSRIKAQLTAVDINPDYKKFSDENNSYVKEYLVADIADLHDKFDVVVSSHTVEHVESPVDFINELCRLSSDFVIIACPFNEGAGNIDNHKPELSPGHRHSITYEIIKGFKPIKIKIYRSLVWHSSLACLFVISTNKN